LVVPVLEKIKKESNSSSYFENPKKTNDFHERISKKKPTASSLTFSHTFQNHGYIQKLTSLNILRIDEKVDS
jgi:hypothetical protein